MYFLIGTMVAVISIIFLYKNEKIFGDENPFHGDINSGIWDQTLVVTLIILVCFILWPLVILYGYVYLLLVNLKKIKKS